MKSHIQIIIFSICMYSSLLNAAQWVAPGEYSFGTCGGSGGDSAPTGFRNQKYYDIYTCNKAYFEEDRCYVYALKLQRDMAESGTLSQCENWLRGEVSNCRNYVRQAGQACAQLDK